MAKKSAASTVYQLKITLRGTKPPIWRRLQVPGRTALPDLNLMIQAAMGWSNSHLHSFTFDGVDYASIEPMWDEMDAEDETKVRLDRVVADAGQHFIYVYDFGDDWQHRIEVEKILAPEPEVSYPVCLGGARRCPPDDVGGIYGYAEFLEAIKNPKHEEHENLLEWVGGEFDPNEFDVDTTNGMLADYRSLDMGL